jgi:hypothetical protein
MLQSLAEPLVARIAGIYKDGVVQLTEAPANIQESKVIVTLLDSTDLDSAISKSALSQENNEDDESPVQSFREGWANVVAGNTIPASKLWD